MGKPLSQAREIIKNDLTEAIDAIADLNQDISASPTEAEVQAISDKVDAILAALRTFGILAT
jgi:acetolactate synthase small subunit